jgi:aminoglycoside 6'-N-acetyltransferase I
MNVRRAGPADISALARLRQGLWPHVGAARHREELAAALAEPEDRIALFVAEAAPGVLAGFGEVSLRHDYVNGCETSPVAFLEGIFVDGAHRRAGVARMIVEAAEAWGAALGCREFASDADIANEDSHQMHLALGFEETERVVCFRKTLPAA